MLTASVNNSDSIPALASYVKPSSIGSVTSGIYSPTCRPTVVIATTPRFPVSKMADDVMVKYVSSALVAKSGSIFILLRLSSGIV